MKKLLAAALAASVLTTGTVQVTEAASKIAVPDLKDKKTVDQLKKGTYSLQGIQLGSSYEQIYKKLGVPGTEYESRSDDWTYLSADYNQVNISSEADSRKAKVADMKVDNIYFDYAGKNYKLKDISAVLGKYKYSETFDNDTKDIKDDTLDREYGHLTLFFERPQGEWVLTGGYINNEVRETVDSSKLKNADFTALKGSEYKAMKKGDYTLFGVKPGMTNAQIVAKVGESSSDDITRKKGQVKEVVATYGSEMNILFNYNVPAGNILKQITFSYDLYDHPQKLTTAEKYLGTATSVKNGSYMEETDTGKQSKIYTTTRQYGKNVKVTAEKHNGLWLVATVTYQ
ncbi:hypothetical protein [Macrococcus carouselicus]|uniref:Uncharacterized protein n=1 Tax=Macrococcus carouselicus TaxID=69969 RepID=A0A9Q8CL92_9STAP|nr:hypothetical protein [Macrococcus carouselicus]TDM04698.1 hypothetical protein ERX40_05935 [Macrococcus carouselicus]